MKGRSQNLGRTCKFLDDPDHSPRPRRETSQSASNFFIVDGDLYRSYLPGHLRKRISCQDQLVVLSALRSLIIQACHDLPASGGHLAFKVTFDRVQDRYRWPTMHRDIQSCCTSCNACQRRKAPHHRPTLTGHVPVD